MKRLVVATMLITFLMALVGTSITSAEEQKAQESLNIIRTQAENDVVVYSIPLYEGTCESSVFTILKEKLQERGLLLQTTTTIKMYMASDKMLFEHELVAHNTGKVKTKPMEFITVVSNAKDKIENFATKMQKEKQFKVDSAYQTDMAGLVMYVVALSR